jgi:hypothetical protein
VEKKAEERTHMARLFPGHARTAGSASKTADVLRKTAESQRNRAAEAVKKSLDFLSPVGSTSAADCDILNKIMAGMSDTLLKKD